MVDAINKRVQHVRGTTRVVDKYIGPIGQIVIDISRMEIRLQDGKTPGGHRLLNSEAMARAFMSSDSEFGSVEFASDIRGFLVRVGDKDYQTRNIDVDDDMVVNNGDGLGGNPTIGMPLSFKPTLTQIADANLAITTGFFVVTPGALSNLPTPWLTTADTQITVTAHTHLLDTIVDQTAVNALIPDRVSYNRSRVANVWSAWQTDPVDPVTPTGLGTELHRGLNQTAKLWSAADLYDMIRDLVSSIQYIDPANAAKAWSFNELFNLLGAGTQVTQTIVGPYNMATLDRFELGASATAIVQPGGDNQTAKIEVEVDSAWQQIASAVAISLSTDSDSTTAEVVGRIVKTGTGYQVADADWAVGSNIVGTLSGRFRVTIGATGKAGARGQRWR